MSGINWAWSKPPRETLIYPSSVQYFLSYVQVPENTFFGARARPEAFWTPRFEGRPSGDMPDHSCEFGGGTTWLGNAATKLLSFGRGRVLGRSSNFFFSSESSFQGLSNEVYYTQLRPPSRNLSLENGETTTLEEEGPSSGVYTFTPFFWKWQISRFGGVFRAFPWLGRVVREPYSVPVRSPGHSAQGRPRNKHRKLTHS